MKELVEMSKALDESADMRHRWKSLKIDWHPEYPFNARKKLKLRRRILDEIKNRLESGKRDENEIADEVCQSLIGTIFITAVIQAIIKVMAKRLVEWWEKRRKPGGYDD